VIFIPVYVLLGAAVWLLMMRELRPLDESDAKLIEQIVPAGTRGILEHLLSFLRVREEELSSQPA
ncbi:MAG: hypothetical protein RAK25_04775, partial [TACK group archaeon]|nr:hypothetical protein [TACK group archaeon]